MSRPSDTHVAPEARYHYCLRDSFLEKRGGRVLYYSPRVEISENARPPLRYFSGLEPPGRVRLLGNLPPFGWTEFRRPRIAALLADSRDLLRFQFLTACETAPATGFRSVHQICSPKVWYAIYLESAN